MNITNKNTQYSSQLSDLGNKFGDRSYVSGSISPHPSSIFKNLASNRPVDFSLFNPVTLMNERAAQRAHQGPQQIQHFTENFFDPMNGTGQSSKFCEAEIVSKSDFPSINHSQDIFTETSNLYFKNFEKRDPTVVNESANQSFSWLRSPQNGPPWPGRAFKTSLTKRFDLNQKAMNSGHSEHYLSDLSAQIRHRKNSIGLGNLGKAGVRVALSTLSQKEEALQSNSQVMDLELSGLSHYQELEKSHSNERRSNSNDSPRLLPNANKPKLTKSALQSGLTSRGRGNRRQFLPQTTFNSRFRPKSGFFKRARGRGRKHVKMRHQLNTEKLCNPFSDSEEAIKGQGGGIKPSFSKFNGLALQSGLSNTPSHTEQFKLSRKNSMQSWLDLSFAQNNEIQATQKKKKLEAKQPRVNKKISKKNKPKRSHRISKIFGNVENSDFDEIAPIKKIQNREPIQEQEGKEKEPVRHPSFGSSNAFQSPEVTWRTEALTNVLEKSPNHQFDQFQMIAEFCDAIQARLAETKQEKMATPDLLSFIGQTFFESKQNNYEKQAILDQLSPVFKNLSFSSTDIKFMSSLFKMTSFLYQQKPPSQNIFINPKTNTLFAKIDNRPTALTTPKVQANLPAENNLISFSDFQKQVKADFVFTPNYTPQDPNPNCCPKLGPPAKTQQIKSNRRSKSKKKRQKGCKCSKSKCLRLHCVCFRNGTFCSPSCGCKNCYNTEKESKLVEKVRSATKDINSQAFESRFVEVEIDGKVKKFTKGCSCSKNNCLKNYCECRKNGMPCTPLCKCENCYNCKVALDPELAAKLHRKSSRKKKKIIFKKISHNKLEMTEQVLMANYKKL